MTTLYGSLRLRPTRLGFLIDPSDLPVLRTVMRLCTGLWGGLYNPMIPVCDELPKGWQTVPAFESAPEVTRGYIRFFEPDFFIECREGLAAKAGIRDGEPRFGQPRVFALKDFAEPPSRSRVPVGLCMEDLYLDLYQREFKFLRRAEHRIALIEHAPEIAEAEAFLEASVGLFPTSGPLSFLHERYQTTFEPTACPPTPEGYLDMLRRGFQTPLSLTCYELRTDGASHAPGPCVFILDPTKPADLIDLWNLRQCRLGVTPVPVGWIAVLRDFLRETVVRSHRALPDNPFGVIISTEVQFSRSIEPARARSLAQELLGDLPNSAWCLNVGGYPALWLEDRESDSGGQPSRSLMTASSTTLDLTLERGRSTMSIRFAPLVPEFAQLSEPALFNGGGTAKWVNVLHLRDFAEATTAAVVLPSGFGAIPGCNLRAGGPIYVTREGLVLLHTYPRRQEVLDVLSGEQAISKWLLSRSMSTVPSDPGLITQQVLAAVGGPRGASLLADRETLHLLDEMAKSVRVYADGRREEFPDRARSVEQWQGLISRRKQKGGLSRVELGDFLNANILKLGLELQCPTCLHHNWFSLQALAEHVTCDRCLKGFAFPQGDLNFRKTPWFYRIVGAFATPDFAQGAYATALTVRALRYGLGAGIGLTYSTGLVFRPDTPDSFEVDLVAWYTRYHSGVYGADEEPSLLFAETKSFATEGFTEKDLSRMQVLGETFPGAFLIFATLKESLSDAEQARIAALATKGRRRLADGTQSSPVIVLTATELFADTYIQSEWEAKTDRRRVWAQLPSVHLDNLWNLAELTQQIYLGLPPLRPLVSNPGTV